MYDAQQILAIIDGNAVPILLLCGLALLGNALYYFEAGRLAFKDRCYGIPLAGLCFFIPHDMHFVALAQQWFVVYNHWFLKLFWVALIFTSAAAVLFLWQFLKFGRREWLPDSSITAFYALSFTALGAGLATWLSIKSLLDDPLFLVAFGITAFWCAPFSTALMLKRGHSGGNSPRMWLGFTMIPIFYWLSSYLYFPGIFRSLPWLALGVITACWGLFNARLAGQLPKTAKEAQTS